MLLFCHPAPAETPPGGSTCSGAEVHVLLPASLSPARLPALSASLPSLSRCVNSQVGLVVMAPAPSTLLSLLLPGPFFLLCLEGLLAFSLADQNFTEIQNIP